MLYVPRKYDRTALPLFLPHGYLRREATDRDLLNKKIQSILHTYYKYKFNNKIHTTVPYIYVYTSYCSIGLCSDERIFNRLLRQCLCSCSPITLPAKEVQCSILYQPLSFSLTLAPSPLFCTSLPVPSTTYCILLFFFSLLPQ